MMATQEGSGKFGVLDWLGHGCWQSKLRINDFESRQHEAFVRVSGNRDYSDTEC